MVDSARLERNRRAALNSTGPRTPEGKARVRYNGVRHGLAGRSVLLPGEDQGEFTAFVAQLTDDLAPDGALEAVLAERVVGCAWRLRRALRVEAGIFASHVGDLGAERFGQAFIVDGVRSNAFTNLSRYETSLSNQLMAALHELQRVQLARAGRGQAPAAVDVVVTPLTVLEGGDNGFASRE